MTMTAHTPGPWRYERTDGIPVNGRHMISGAVPGYLAEVRDCVSGDVQANARLIAAAPDLLAALETAYMALIGYLPAHRNDVTDAAIGAARAAITKATGEAA